jgi:hypothetical protein
MASDRLTSCRTAHVSTATVTSVESLTALTGSTPPGRFGRPRVVFLIADVFIFFVYRKKQANVRRNYRLQSFRRHQLSRDTSCYALKRSDILLRDKQLTSQHITETWNAPGNPGRSCLYTIATQMLAVLALALPSHRRRWIDRCARGNGSGDRRIAIKTREQQDMFADLPLRELCDIQSRSVCSNSQIIVLDLQ